MMLKLAKMIESPIACVLGKVRASPCSSVAQFIANYLCNLQGRDLWPINEMLQKGTISRALRQIDSFPDSTFNAACKYACIPCTDGIPNVRQGLLDGKKKFFGTKIGACLDCIKTEEESLQKGEYRIKHQYERKCKRSKSSKSSTCSKFPANRQQRSNKMSIQVTSREHITSLEHDGSCNQILEGKPKKRTFAAW